MPEGTWSLPLSLALFALAMVMVIAFGLMMTRTAAVLAERTGLGEAVMGAFFVGATTSLPEIATSVTASFEGYADLALSNAIGSVAGQTAFLALADMTYRRVNLEHAAASAENLMLASFVLVMLAIPLLGLALPQATIGGIHPASILMLLAYLQGMRMVSQTHKLPMWLPRRTRETRTAADSESTDKVTSLPRLWLQFALAAAMTAIAGWLLARTAIPIAIHTGLSETIIGGLLTGLTGSLPEFITALAAVRMGALTLAVGDILGGNAFDALIIAFSDWSYPGISVFRAAGQDQIFLLALTVLLTSVLLMGMLHREKHGIVNIGLESFMVLLLYTGAYTLLLTLG
jgi:cation:H+ antiporter